MQHHAVEELIDRVGDRADRALRQWDAREKALGPLRIGEVELGNDVDRGALIDGEPAGVLGELRMSCTAVAPVPISPILWPAGLKPSSHAVVWMILPSNSWMPGISGCAAGTGTRWR